MKAIKVLTVLGLLVWACADNSENMNHPNNPFYQVYDTPHGVPPFDLIKDEHYMDAFNDGIWQMKGDIQAIASLDATPTFKNTIEAMEKSGELLTRVSQVFFNLSSANTTDSMQNINKVISPKLSGLNDDIFLNNALFKRVSTLYDSRSQRDYSEEQNKLLEDTYTRFIRAGAALNNDQKTRMREINERLSTLTVQFAENLLAENNTFKLYIADREALIGLPDNVIQAGAEAAREENKDGQYLYTLHKPSLIPFITYSQQRNLREKLMRGYLSKGHNDNELNNLELVREIANLRLEKANLLGYPTHAHYILEERMLNTPEKVYELMDKVWPAALEKAKEERNMMQAMADGDGQQLAIRPWDWWYYAEKIKREKYQLDEEAIRAYLQVDNVINGTFTLAKELFGLTFKEVDNVPKYHTEVRTYEVSDRDDQLIGIYLSDWFYRSSKRGGAWMNTYRDQSQMDGEPILPIVVNVGNFTKPQEGKPSLLSQDEALTLFHEFGHALHGLLSACTYPSISGTSTPRDFVEFPSQLMENWVFEPEMLKRYAFHYETGAVMPEELVKKIKKAGQFNQGFATVEYLATAYLDMAYHTITKPITGDVAAFEKQAMDALGLIDAIAPRYRTGYFQHAFAGTPGYSAGYYSYLNSETMDADAFLAFKENGLFDKETATRYKEEILSKGGTRDAMDMYVAFRGRRPDFNALLDRRGLK